MVIYPGTNRFYCFGCCETGNAFELIKKVKGIDFNDAVKWSQGTFGNSYSKTNIRKLRKKNNRVKLISADIKNIEVYNYFYGLLGISNKAIDYLKSRGLSSEIIDNGEILSVENPTKIYKQLQKNLHLKI